MEYRHSVVVTWCNVLSLQAVVR